MNELQYSPRKPFPFSYSARTQNSFKCRTIFRRISSNAISNQASFLQCLTSLIVFSLSMTTQQSNPQGTQATECPLFLGVGGRRFFYSIRGCSFRLVM